MQGVCPPWPDPIRGRRPPESRDLLDKKRTEQRNLALEALQNRPPAMKFRSLQLEQALGKEVTNEGQQVVPDPLRRSVVLGEQSRVDGP